MKNTGIILWLMLCTAIFSAACGTKSNAANPNAIIADNDGMAVYVIEREIPGVGKLTQEELKAIAKKSCSVLDGLGNNHIKWLHSYVTDDKMYCVFSTNDTNAIIAHGKNGGFPVNSVSRVQSMISPATTK